MPAIKSTTRFGHDDGVVEGLAVLIVLAMLMLLALAAYFDQRVKATDAAAVVSLRLAQVAAMTLDQPGPNDPAPPAGQRLGEAGPIDFAAAASQGTRSVSVAWEADTMTMAARGGSRCFFVRIEDGGAQTVRGSAPLEATRCAAEEFTAAE